MAVKPLKPKQRGPYCERCKTNRATHRGYGHRLSCDEHDCLEWLNRMDRKDRAPDYSDAQFYAGY